MALYGLCFSGALLITAYLSMHLIHVTTAECPLDMNGSNFTLVASMCSNRDGRAKCCRYINAFIALSIGRYANQTGNLGVPSDSSEICLSTLSRILGLHGVPSSVAAFCGFGTKILVNYGCMGRETVNQMTESPKFGDIADNCELSLSEGDNCRRCLNSEISYLRHLVGAEDNLTMSTCRDATFSALASRVNNRSAVDIANCFFGVSIYVPSVPSSPTTIPESPPSSVAAESPNQSLTAAPIGQHHRRSYHLTLIPAIGIAVTVFAVIMLVILVILIRRKSKELEDGEHIDEASSKAFPPPHPPPRSVRNLQDGPTSMFRKFGYKEIKKATEGFSTEIGHGGFGTVYRGQFSDGLVMGVKRMNIVSKQGEEEFCREIELLARLHHRHLVSLRGFCVDKKERFLLYEYMANGSLKDHLHSPNRTPLSWQTRIQIAIDVANALEYLHFYCDPPLCHRDIKSSNILLDENFVAKVADFGLAHASNNGSVCFEPVNTDVCGTPGYMDPEYTITQELTEKSDVYSYGVLVLEMITGRGAVQDGLNLIEWSQIHSAPDSRLPEIVDPAVLESLDLDQLSAMGSIVRWCTQKEGWSRPSIKQVLRVLYESSDPMDESGFAEAIEDEENEGRSSKRTKGKVVHSGDARCLASSSSTSRSYCSRSFLLDNGNGSPHSPPSNILSI